MNKQINSTYRIRPSGRHILTIGRELIKDRCAAVIELVKNAYDADANEVKITFSSLEREVDGKLRKCLSIEVEDNGHGMSEYDVVNKWLVPSTDDKLNRIFSPSGRRLQGRYGIGRYAASILGDDLLLETVGGEQLITTLFVEWNSFAHAKYLENIEVPLHTTETNKASGTKLTMTGNEEYLDQWTYNEINKLRFELKKLLPPIQFPKKEFAPPESISLEELKESFSIILEFKDFPVPEFQYISEIIEPFPLVELYDYRIYGKVSNEGKANLFYQNNRLKKSQEEKIEFVIYLNVRKDIDMDYCGEVFLDFRVYDREREAIDNLINKGLKDPITKRPIGRRQTINLLNSFNGVGVYRNNFRIRPLGDPGYDWLELDKSRVQNPSMKIGSNQVIGFIHIQPEEASCLKEKSARDGLKENKYYYGLIEISKKVLQKLEEKRFIYRQKARLGRKSHNLEKKIEPLSDFSALQSKILKILENAKVEKNTITVVEDLIKRQESQAEGNMSEIRNAIATYQGHATLGKIVNVILHEGRRPLNYFKNQTPILRKWRESLQKEHDPALLAKMMSRIERYENLTELFVMLFNNLDPLASSRRSKKKKLSLNNLISDSFQIFENELKSFKISSKIQCDKDLKIYGWKEDFTIIFANLIDNSIYWLNAVEREQKLIEVNVYSEGDEIIIDFFDNGPGIENELIDNEIIFEPEFSRKSEGGVGLGLIIAREAINRNNGQLNAVYYDNGAFFRMTLKGDPEWMEQEN